MSLDKEMMPVPDGHPSVFDREWPLRVGDINRTGRLRLDAACRHIQDIGQDQLREMGFEETHPLWIVRRTMVDLIRPSNSRTCCGVGVGVREPPTGGVRCVFASMAAKAG
ncbi:acyl-ACP thioesterase family protein [Mycobacterium ulcerans str. Harvey]|uniref:Acyl-ACP thioesterase family protein n=1 Tax=Mycobacterium ulcerans str. Harvey TaxID=1299332 RepID=A0ABN0QND7_MYCUL|nr:acyl-ACP thioesterase family protein [Mycobacterium ulcerans str. Harvey]